MIFSFCSCQTSCRASRACRAGRQQQQGISTLFPARHGFPYVGRMSGMSGAPDFMGHHAGRMDGKNEKTDLTQAEKNNMRRLTALLAAYGRQKP